MILAATISNTAAQTLWRSRDVPEPSITAAGRHDVPANAAVAAGHGVARARSVLEVG